MDSCIPVGIEIIRFDDDSTISIEAGKVDHIFEIVDLVRKEILRCPVDIIETDGSMIVGKGILFRSKIEIGGEGNRSGRKGRAKGLSLLGIGRPSEPREIDLEVAHEDRHGEVVVIGIGGELLVDDGAQGGKVRGCRRRRRQFDVVHGRTR